MAKARVRLGALFNNNIAMATPPFWDTYAQKYLQLLEECLVDPAGNLHFKESQAAHVYAIKWASWWAPKIYGIYELRGADAG